MSNVLETAKVLVAPAEKLISVVQGAVGKWYEPRHIKNLADARAYEIETVSRALRENSDIPIIYENGVMTMDTNNFEELAKRAQRRLAYQELTKQENIEHVTTTAYELLQNEKEIPDAPVDQDWFLRFFNCIEDISNNDMQML